MNEDDQISVPIKVRTHEISQFHEMLPEVSEELESIEHNDAEDFGTMYEEHISDLEATYPAAPQDESFAAWASMPAEEWRLLIRHVNRYDDARAKFLQSKLMRRLEGRLEEAA